MYGKKGLCTAAKSNFLGKLVNYKYPWKSAKFGSQTHFFEKLIYKTLIIFFGSIKSSDFFVGKKWLCTAAKSQFLATLDNYKCHF